MIDKGDTVVCEKYFTFHETECIARTYRHSGYVYGEICYAHNNERPYRAMRRIAWEYLKSIGVHIDGTITYQSVKVLVEKLQQS